VLLGTLTITTFLFTMLHILVLFAGLAAANRVGLEDFSKTKYRWTTQNDPVMGGKSFSNIKIENGLLKYKGETKIVPSLKATGFIQAKTQSYFWEKNEWPDVSSCAGIGLHMRSMNDFSRFFLSFGNSKPTDNLGNFFQNFFAWGHKAPFSAPRDQFGDVLIPFGEFSNYWDDATGDAIVTCEKNSNYCPTKGVLRSLGMLSIWGEGGEPGVVDIEVKQIFAYGCGGAFYRERPAPTEAPAPTAKPVPAPTAPAPTAPAPTEAPEEEGCGHEGYLLKTKKRGTRHRRVKSACECASLCGADQEWTLKTKRGQCQCYLPARGNVRIKRNKNSIASRKE